MNEAPDPLEAELTALRPQEVSPGLRQRVAERLADVPTARHLRLWRLGLAGGLAAACLTAILVWWGGGRRLPPLQADGPPRPAPFVQDSGPTLMAYQRALARSPEELDALLDKHAMVAPESNPDLVRVGASFSRSDATLHALLGED